MGSRGENSQNRTTGRNRTAGRAKSFRVSWYSGEGTTQVQMCRLHRHRQADAQAQANGGKGNWSCGQPPFHGPRVCPTGAIPMSRSGMGGMNLEVWQPAGGGLEVCQPGSWALGVFRWLEPSQPAWLRKVGFRCGMVRDVQLRPIPVWSAVRGLPGGHLQ